MLIIGVIASAIGIAVSLSIDWFPVAGSSQAHKIDTLFDVLLIASVPIFVLVEVVVLFSVWKFRMRPGEERKDGPPIHGNTALEVVWTAIPAILLVGLCSYAYVTLRQIERKPAHEMTVDVTGQQFTWSFRYPNPPSGRPITSDQLYLPLNEPIKFNVRSKDVIHEFWVPEFRVSVDAVPGITTHYRITPIRLGEYPVVCAELCGIGHSTMRQTAHVLPRQAFDAWMAREQAAVARATT
jgi:cytochrome c oxidase subunit 2